jgi:phage terminase large subunit
MYHSSDLVHYIVNPPPNRAPAWVPRSLTVDEWREQNGPDYRGVYAWRMRKLAEWRSDTRLAPDGRTSLSFWMAKQYYAKRENRAEFIMHWMDTYDPRATHGLKWMPFVFFQRQAEFIDFLNGLVEDQENGLVEKCRDAGLTWLACGWSDASWLFEDNVAIGFGSRKEDLVDQAGIPDSIFEKLRLILKRLPREFMPNGFDWRKHSTYMRLLNPENGSTIAGESGDNIGRGGRKWVYFKDESAHYERPDKIEAALGDNTNVQIDISSVNGLGNVFYRRAKAAQTWTPDAVMEPGKTRKFIVDWRDDPRKTQEWYDRRKQRYTDEGLEHVFAQEVERNYAASQSDTIISKEWIDACVDADKKLARLGDWFAGQHTSALDVADGGIDRNSLAIRKSVVLITSKEWGARDVGVTTRNTMLDLQSFPGIQCFYDCIGVGSGVKAEYNRIVDTDLKPWVGKPEYNERMRRFPAMIPWNAGSGVLNPYFRVIDDDNDSPLIRDFFANLKAQAWWSLRTRFWKTFQCIRDETISYPIDQLISLSSAIPLLHQLCDELAQPTRSATTGTLKMVVDKQPDNTKSPNLADAVVMAYFPLPTDFALAVQASYGTA